MSPPLSLLLALALAVPLALAALPLLPPARARLLDCLPFAPLPGLVAALLLPDGARLEAGPLLLGLALELSGTGRLFLGAAAFLWAMAGVYARSYLRDAPRQGGFAAFWCLTLAGNLGVFLAADIATFYTCFALVSLGAYPLVVHGRSAEAIQAGRVYIGLAVLGEVLLFAGLVMAAGGLGTLAIADIRAALVLHPDQALILGLLIAGFGIKAGLVPLHVWLPLAHPVAPTPASAVLSGAIVKAGIFGLVQFLPLGLLEPTAPAPVPWPLVVTVAGLVTAYYGILLGLTQRRPKVILAYSTLSQMGLVIALLGSGLASGDATPVLAAAAFYALHHGLAKGALFLAVGLAEKADARALAWVVTGAALTGLAVAGLPFSGGSLAKLALKESFASGPALTFAIFSAIGTTLLLGRFVLALAAIEGEGERLQPGLVLPWLALIVAALVAPWLLWPAAIDVDRAYALSNSALFDSSWPILGAAVVAILAAAEPESDLEKPARRIAAAALLRLRHLRWPAPPDPAPLLRRLARVGGLADRLEAALLRWALAGTALVAAALVLAFSIWP